MSHKQATPNEQRPTFEELRWLDAYAQRERFCIVEVRGLWDQSEREFKVILKGCGADVHETIEMLKENGNLMGLEFFDITE